MFLSIRKTIWILLAQFLVLSWAKPAAGWAATTARPAGMAVSGHVYNKANQPLAGVVITIQGGAAMQGGASVTATNAEGAFYLTYAGGEAPALVFKFAGYQTQTLRVRAKIPVSIRLYEVGTPMLPQDEGVEMVVESVETPDVLAAYPGGAPAYQAYMNQNMRYPEAAKAKGTEGLVMVSFTVDEQGRILSPEVVKGIEGLNEEALRLVSHMPWWAPARRNGKPMRSSSYLRIRFVFHQE
jgi:TonB family protein